jgi:hypothetical protein
MLGLADPEETGEAAGTQDEDDEFDVPEFLR